MEAHPLSLAIHPSTDSASDLSGGKKRNEEIKLAGNGAETMTEAGKLSSRQCLGGHRSHIGSSKTGTGGSKTPLSGLSPIDTCSGTSPPRKGKGKEKKSSLQERAETSEKKQRMRPATEVISRIQWDPDLPAGDFIVGYLDRFTGVIEKPFDAFFWEDISSVGATVLAVPKHRIQYFKYKGEIVWDKRVQLDNFFGSRGTRTIQDIVSQPSMPQPRSEGEQQSSERCSNSSEESNLLEAEADLEDLVPGTPHHLSNKKRPTHFICVHVTDELVKSQVGEIQQYITKYTPQLSEGCLPVSALHVTLCMVKLSTEQDEEVAKQVMSSCRSQFISLLPRCVQLTFEGVDNFRNRLVYVKVKHEPALTKLVSFLLEQFQLAEIKTPGNHDQYTPHMTIVKLTRPLCREMHTNLINPTSYQPFLDISLGCQTINALSLCSMTAPKQSDGFYLRLATISNSLHGLSPSIVCLVEQQLGKLAERGYLTDYERDQFLQELSSPVRLEDDKKFESVVTEMLLFNEEANTLEAPVNPSTVVIMRGLPGSGKSHIANNCLEMKKNHSQTVVISADDFFTQEGQYNFLPALAYKAHQHCIQQLLDALMSRKKLIVIDNTNSRLWEYRLYLYLSEVLGYRCHILEIPCPTASVAERFCSRNLHSVKSQAVMNIFKRWEKDKRAMLVPPRIAYPLEWPRQEGASVSLLSLCHDTSVSQLDNLMSSTGITAVYVGVFLTIDSQWMLLSAFPPAHTNLYTTHTTLVFQPTYSQLSRAAVGRKVTLQVVGSADNGRIQAVAVELPHKLSSQNEVAHITISTIDGVPPRLSDSLLQSQLVRCRQGLLLEGVIGVVLREATEEELKGLQPSSETYATSSFVIVKSTDEMKQLLPKVVFKQHPKPSEVDVTKLNAQESLDIVTGEVGVTKLFIFDFDGTLFIPPDPAEGRRQYEQHTRRRWPHKGWLSWPASLLPPLKVLPGPALSEFYSHHGQAGSLTIVLTGRVERTRPAVLSVMENAQLFPHRVILKPNVSDQSTANFKLTVMRQLLDEFPGVNLVKFWDDLPQNLAAIRCLSQSGADNTQFQLIDASRLHPSCLPKQEKSSGLQPLPSLSPPHQSLLESHLAVYGLLPTREYEAAAQEGVDFLVSQFARLVGYTGKPSNLAYPFGSYPLGRMSDVDLCLLAPPTSSPMGWISQLSSQLDACGIKFVHIGHSTRCPRLKVMLEFTEAPAIEYDLVIAVLDEDRVFRDTAQSKLPASQVAKMRKTSDSQSKAALSGPLFLEKVEHVIGDVLSKDQFGAIVEMTVQLLIAKREKGNAFGCIHTFHLVQLLADFIRSYSSKLSALPNLDAVMQSFICHVSQLPLDKWEAVIGDTVPEDFIPRVMSVFQNACRILTEENGHPSLSCYSQLLERTEFPPEGHTAVEIKLTGSSPVLKWKARTLIEARLPTYIRQLLTKGLQVVSDGNVKNGGKLCFAVPSLKSAKETLQTVLRAFWSEMSEYRKKEGLQIHMTFGKPSDTTTTTSIGQTVQAKQSPNTSFLDLVTSFATTTSTDTELHLSSHLTAHDRLLVHEAAERLGLQHTTITSGREKHIVLRK